MLCDDRDGWDGRQNGKGVEKGGDIRTYTADSLRCTAETNTTFVKQLSVKSLSRV